MAHLKRRPWVSPRCFSQECTTKTGFEVPAATAKEAVSTSSTGSRRENRQRKKGGGQQRDLEGGVWFLYGCYGSKLAEPPWFAATGKRCGSSELFPFTLNAGLMPEPPRAKKHADASATRSSSDLLRRPLSQCAQCNEEACLNTSCHWIRHGPR